MPRPLSVLIVPFAPLEAMRAFLCSASLQDYPFESAHAVDVVHHRQRLSVGLDLQEVWRSSAPIF